jgi:hypothetical protein
MHADRVIEAAISTAKNLLWQNARSTHSLPDGAAELKEMLADMQRDRNAWRDQAQRLALPKPEPEKPMTWWRWLRATG